MGFLYCRTGREITAHLLLFLEFPFSADPPSVWLTCQIHCLIVSLCVIVSVDVRDWKEPAPPAPADMGAPVWTTGLGNNASVWMASLANSVRNVSICL